VKERMKKKLSGLRKPLAKFRDDINILIEGNSDFNQLKERIHHEIKAFGCDKLTIDRVGNIIAEFKGYDNKEDLVVISHVENNLKISEQENIIVNDGSAKAIGNRAEGIISSVYSAILLRNSLLPLSGRLIVCCVPRTASSDFGIKYLFENYFKKRIQKIKGVILCEPTDFNVYLGHKGRMEYEIEIKLFDKQSEQKNINSLGVMLPLIQELQKVSKKLPHNALLGNSSLNIKNYGYRSKKHSCKTSEFKVIVDRAFILEEEKKLILEKAKSIAMNLYQGNIKTSVVKEYITTKNGLKIVASKEFLPWQISKDDPFALGAMNVLRENGIKSKFGYWQKIITEGSYTFGKHKLATIGFGTGIEDQLNISRDSLSISKLEKSILLTALIIYRAIGIPSFGWVSD